MSHSIPYSRRNRLKIGTFSEYEGWHFFYGDEMLALTDTEALALTIYGEARGESIEGQIAVACVIRNRVNSQNKTYTEICQAPFQFSCWNPFDVNYSVLNNYANQMIAQKTIIDPTLNQCIWIATGIISNSILDNTKGALNYVTMSLLISGNAPRWAQNMTNKIQIGNQMFGTA